MLATIKIHSAYKKIFNDVLEYNVDLNTYADVLLYLTSSNRKFEKYVKSSELDLIDETFCILDKKREVIGEQDLFIRKVKDQDCFYVVPSIVGGGGKSGKYLLLAAAVAAAAYTGGASLGAFGGSGATVAATGIPASTTGMAGAISSSAAYTAAGGGMAGLGAAASTAWAGMGTIGQTLAVNAGLALATALFTKRKPSDNKQTDSDVRQNDMFGSLKSTISSGTPIPLVYGLHRVSGHLISGYLDTTVHGKNDPTKVSERFG